MDVSHSPKIVIFDLDFTVWPYWADCHLDPPFSTGNGGVKDSSNRTVNLYSDILKIFEFCKEKGLPMAIASKSPETKMYGQLMKLMDIHKYFVQFEIYHRSKDNHMSAISKHRNIDYKDMIFFDDEPDNIRTTNRIGVTAVHCPNRNGLTWDIFKSGLKMHSDKNQSSDKD